MGRLLIAILRSHKDGPWVFAIDRTNWQLGKAHINILMITVIVGKVGFPVCWITLPKRTKKGNSRQFHRIKLAKILLKIVSPEDIEAFVMDREFCGKKWLSWLNKKGVVYVLRIKSNTDIDGFKLSHILRKKQNLDRNQIFNVYGQRAYLASKWVGKNKKGPRQRIIVISNALIGDSALKIYRMRWGIESFFSHCKKRGFNLEDTHMTNAGKINRLLAVVAVAFCICYLKKLPANAQHLHQSKRKSIFRKGMEDIQKILFSQSKRQLKKLLLWLRKSILYDCQSMPINSPKQLVLKGFQKIVV